MKKCDQYKDLILTDFIDGELKNPLLSQLEEHLLDCNDCRIFLKEVKAKATILTGVVSREAVPEALWEAIKNDIENEGARSNPWVEFVEKLKGIFVFPRLVPVFASVALMFFVGSVTLNNIQLQRIKDQDQGEYLVSMLTPTGSASTDSNDPGTPIEHYFL